MRIVPNPARNSAFLGLWQNDYEHYQMPQPQYLGAKYQLLNWLTKHMPINGGVMLDGFGGSQSVAFAMKKMGFAVHTNDFLNFCHQSGIALVANKSAILNKDDVAMLFADNPRRRKIMIRFKNIFFAESECVLLDNFRTNVDQFSCPHKRALALAIMCRSLTRKTIMGHFAHLRAMEYARNPLRVKRNPSIARNIHDLFLDLLPQYNAAVFDNGQDNKSYHGNILEVLPSLADADLDLVYYDPPYCQSHADYQAFYHLLETFVEAWEDKTFINGNQRYHPPRPSGFDKVGDVENSFRRLFALSDDIPYWLISYNDRSTPTVETLAQMARRHKKVRIEEKMYHTSRGGKGSVSGSREFLLICQ